MLSALGCCGRSMGEFAIVFFRWATLGLVGLALVLGASPGLHAARKTTSSLPVTCAAAFKAKAGVSNPAACEAVRRAIAASLRRPVYLTMADGAGPGDHLKVVLRAPRPNAAELSATGRLRGRALAFGPVVVDVMDRPLVQRDVERLAMRMAESLARR